MVAQAGPEGGVACQHCHGGTDGGGQGGEDLLRGKVPKQHANTCSEKP